MQIADGTVVAMDYELKDDEGILLDQSQPGQPLTYLHGHKNIIPGLEASLAGKAAGDTVEVRVAPEDGYGVTNPSLEQVVPRDRFQGVESLEAGTSGEVIPAVRAQVKALCATLPVYAR